MKPKITLTFFLFVHALVFSQVIITPNPFGVNNSSITFTYGALGDFSLFNAMGANTIYLYTGLETDAVQGTWDYHDNWNDLNSLIPLHWNATQNAYVGTFDFINRNYYQEPSGNYMQIPNGTNVYNWYFLLRNENGLVQSGDLMGSDYGFDDGIYSNDYLNQIIAHYPLNGNANNSISTSYYGLLNGTVAVNDRNNIPNSAIKLNGINDFMSIPYTSDLLPNHDTKSYSFWLKFDDQDNSDIFIFQNGNADLLDGQFRIELSNSGEGTGTILTLLNSHAAFGGGDNAAYLYHSISCFNTSIFHHLVITVNNTQINYFLNGQKIGNRNWNLPYDTTDSNFDINIGRFFNSYGGGYQQYFNGIIDDIKIFNVELNEDNVLELYNAEKPENHLTFCCVQWTGTPNLNTEQNQAFEYLCTNNIINSNQLATDIENPLKREELAKIAFRALYKPDVDAVTPADHFPSPFIDLQESNYKKEALALCYLEYGDGISAFNREFTHFRPNETIQRQHALKLLMETFNIVPASAGTAPLWGSTVYTDIAAPNNNFEMYYYIVKAYQLGFLTDEPTFRPFDAITREEAFVWLYKMLYESNPYPIPTEADFFIPNNINEGNFNRLLSLNDANFNSYTKTSFALSGVVPLQFTHTYNSANTELPNGYIGIKPLGEGWTHNYNTYLREVNGGLNANNEPIEPRTLIYWGDGTFTSFKLTNGSYVPESAGVYATLSKTGSTYEYVSKNKVHFVFNQLGDYFTLTSVFDRNNNTTTLLWQTGVNTPRLVEVSDPNNRKIIITYVSGTDLINQVTETALNRHVTYTYTNNQTDLASYTDPKGNVTQYVYEDFNNPITNHLLKQIILPKGNMVNNTYQQRKLLSSSLEGSYQTQVNRQPAYQNNVANAFYQTDISVTREGNSLTTHSVLNTMGKPTGMITPTSNLNMSYTSTDPTKLSGIINNTTGLQGNMQYDTHGNVTQITKSSAGSSITEFFTYNDFNDVTTHTNARNFTTHFNYNTQGNLTQTVDALGNQTNILVNPNGTVQRVTNPMGIFTEFEYNTYGNVTKNKLMNTFINETQYDNAGRVIKTINPLGIESTFSYDLNDLMLQTTADPTGLNNQVGYQYDNNDNLLQIVNPMGTPTELEYNDQDQLVEYSFAGFTKTYTYNEDGTLQSFTDQNSVNFINQYNADGTIANDGYASYTYNADKTLHSISKIGMTNSFIYDDLKRVTQTLYNDFTANANNGVKYTYDNNDNITQIEYPNGFKVGYEYDALDRLIRVFNAQNNANYATYSYLADSRLSEQTNCNGTKTVYGYDAYGRLNSISNRKSDNTVLYEQNYTMDALGNHLSETTTEPNSPSVSDFTDATIPYMHNTANRMLTKGTESYGYDGNGNMLHVDATTDVAYTYDAKDNLLTASNPTLTFEYDALENRRLRNQTRFVLDIVGGNHVLMETDLSGNPTAYYIHGLGLICRLDATQANPSYYHYDYRGSTTAITNASQTPTHTYKYGPFGEVWGSTENGYTNTFRYVGKYGVQFESNQLYYMRARYYNPLQGRFLGEDPIWNTNLYAYCDNNPIRYIDPIGLLKYETYLSNIFERAVTDTSNDRLDDSIDILNSIKNENIKKDKLVLKLQELRANNSDYFYYRNVNDEVSQTLRMYLSWDNKGKPNNTLTKLYRILKNEDINDNKGKTIYIKNLMNIIDYIRTDYSNIFIFSDDKQSDAILLINSLIIDINNGFEEQE